MSGGTQIVTSVAAMRSVRAEAQGNVGLVPTMGALHEGHLSLVRAAKSQCETVIVSIFVNPLQFGPKEDFGKYPRTLEQDVALLNGEGVSMVFAPTVEEMYPAAGAGTLIDVPEIGARLDGRARPGHFRGVATVVGKLLHMARPHMAFFGQKDAAQVAVLKAMVRDLNFPVELKVCPTVREPDGLAMSSRNQYLKPVEREQARVLYRALCAAEEAVMNGMHRSTEVQEVMFGTLGQESAVVVEYAEVVDPDTLMGVEDLSRGALLAIAARVGATRLIDNILVSASRESGQR